MKKLTRGFSKQNEYYMYTHTHKVSLNTSKTQLANIMVERGRKYHNFYKVAPDVIYMEGWCRFPENQWRLGGKEACPLSVWKSSCSCNRFRLSTKSFESIKTKFYWGLFREQSDKIILNFTEKQKRVKIGKNSWNNKDH